MLETGDFILVGAAKVQKTDVRVIAATNKDLLELVNNGKFRQDLYYRLNTVPIRVPALHDRKEDIVLLFRKFAVDFAEKYKTAPVQLDDDAKNLLINYSWPGNVRELKNIAEQISVLSQDKQIGAKELAKFLPEHPMSRLPVLAHANGQGAQEFSNEREILYKLFFDMKKDVTELKRMFLEILQNPGMVAQNQNLVSQLTESDSYRIKAPELVQPSNQPVKQSAQAVLMPHDDIHQHVEVEESLNIMDKERELII